MLNPPQSFPQQIPQTNSMPPNGAFPQAATGVDTSQTGKMEEGINNGKTPKKKRSKKDDSSSGNGMDSSKPGRKAKKMKDNGGTFIGDQSNSASLQNVSLLDIPFL